MKKVCRGKPRAFNMVIPDATDPVWHFFYLCLANELHDRDCFLTLESKEEAENYEHEDFTFEQAHKLAKYINNTNGSFPKRFISSAEDVYSKYQEIPDDALHVIFHDYFFSSADVHFLQRGHTLCRHIYGEEIARMQFYFAYKYILKEEIPQKCEKIAGESDKFLCFMEKGFYEDGIDIILSGLYQYAVSGNSKVQVQIKVPAYEQLFDKQYPLHNTQSRKSLVYEFEQKIHKDTLLLLQTQQEIRSWVQVEIIRENLSVSALMALVEKAETIICCTRMTVVTSEIYAAILVGKKVIIPDGAVFLNQLREYVFPIATREVSAPLALDIPVNSGNANFTVGVSSAEDLNKLLSCMKGLPLQSCSPDLIFALVQEVKNLLLEFIIEIFKGERK
jgi:hypothetical protein